MCFHVFHINQLYNNLSFQITYLVMESWVAGEEALGKSSEIPVDTGLGSEDISNSVPVDDGAAAEIFKWILLLKKLPKKIKETWVYYYYYSRTQSIMSLSETIISYRFVIFLWWFCIGHNQSI